ncbi:MAG: Hsp20/alpha crystallin family protein [Polyangiaceae bacterium]|nr:Hsp20/alpha crystallin family protein [Polyangiaceae bacterium]
MATQAQGEKHATSAAPTETSKQKDIERIDFGRGSALARHPGIMTPFRMMSRFMSEMDRIFDSLGMGGLSLATSELGAMGWNPRVETFVRNGMLVVRADLPGIPEDQIDVKVEEGVLSISGERRDDRSEQKEGYWHSERSYGRFQRSIALPRGVQESSIEASFDRGVLQVTVPLPENKGKGRSIPIGNRAKGQGN